MKRRSFLKRSSLVAAGTMFTPMFLQQTLGKNFKEYTGKRVVIIQFSGGNDGLNTIVPFLDDNYYNARPSLALKKAEVINLANDLGINGEMKGFADLFHKGYVSIINNVGYPNPNRSHFRSMDIWHTASDSDEYISTGWLGRYLDSYCTFAREGIEMDNTLSLSMKGNKVKGIAVDNPQTFYNSLNVSQFESLAKSTDDDMLNEDNQGYLYKTLAEANQSAKYVYEHSKIYKSKSTFPKSQLGKNLKSVAEMIQSGMDSKVYYASLGGFDTHAYQKGKQNSLLKDYSASVSAFVEELERTDHFKDTVIMTFSEFGRRVKQNASGGTDHGAANNVFLIGKNLKQPGFVNENPNLESLNRGDLIHSVDFRSVYADLLDNWLSVSSSEILSKKHKTLPLV
ncbi:DUF1501 domain-containing protein [Flammeovirga agarivorans]|uniref:DUF1501 domain-containing protein n=1 Tax=Flammeovirga agarivorans TaxID=2726742 RepID=A0A7X8SI93_9BACT|nr:DUF1501 domain-containing protein [Flammeovirga agarivorans]NLR90731.1 DUF1501 domain-containing protein [Flammeovirga agarivorans]